MKTNKGLKAYTGHLGNEKLVSNDYTFSTFKQHRQPSKPTVGYSAATFKRDGSSRRISACCLS